MRIETPFVDLRKTGRLTDTISPSGVIITIGYLPREINSVLLSELLLRDGSGCRLVGT